MARENLAMSKRDMLKLVHLVNSFIHALPLYDMFHRTGSSPEVEVIKSRLLTDIRYRNGFASNNL